MPNGLNLDLCNEHHKPLNLYCQNEECNVRICTQCITQHNKHDLVDYESTLREKIDFIEAELNICQDEISTAKNDMEDVANKVIREIQRRKATFVSRFDQMIESVNNSRSANGQAIENYATSVRECLNNLEAAKNNPEQVDLTEIENKAKILCQKESAYSINEYQTSRLDPATTDRVFGKLIPKQVVVSLSGQNKCADFITCGKFTYLFSGGGRNKRLTIQRVSERADMTCPIQCTGANLEGAGPP